METGWMETGRYDSSKPSQHRCRNQIQSYVQRHCVSSWFPQADDPVFTEPFEVVYLDTYAVHLKGIDFINAKNRVGALKSLFSAKSVVL